MKFPRLLALALAPLLLTACSRRDAGPYLGSTDRLGPPTTLYINNGAEPEHIDPGLAHDGNSYALVFALFEGLTAYHPVDLHPTQGVAERWDRSDDGLVYRFHLRRDARWSDGRPVTGGDFVYAWKRLLQPATASPVAAILYPLLNAEAFNLGRLRVARGAVVVRREPRSDSVVVASMAAGTAVRLVASPGKESAWVEVEGPTRLPTYGAAPDAPARAGRGPGGFVRADELADDDGPVGVRAPDDATVEVELERPIPYFLDLTSYPNLAPLRRDVVEPFELRGERDRWTRPEHLVTNGPFALESWRLNYEITMKRSPFYWSRDKLALERVVWFESESAFTAMNLYKAGQLDVFGDNVSYPPEYGPILERRQDHHRFPALSTYWYQTNVAKPPLDDARVRRALALAVDKRLLTDAIVKGALPATHYVPDVTGLGYAEQGAADRAAGRDPFAGPGIDFEPERARALLREAGYVVEADADGYRASGFPALEILYNGGDSGSRNLAVAIQDMWRRHLGVQPRLRGEEWKVLLADKRDGRFQVVAGAWGLDYNHPHAILETFLSTSPDNATGWASAEFDAAFREAAATVDPGEGIRCYRRAERIALDGMARIPLYFFTGTSLVKPYVRGYHDNPRGIHLLQFVRIDPDWERSPDPRPAYAPLEFPPPGVLGAQP